MKDVPMVMVLWDLTYGRTGTYLLRKIVASLGRFMNMLI